MIKQSKAVVSGMLKHLKKELDRFYNMPEFFLMFHLKEYRNTMREYRKFYDLYLALSDLYLEQLNNDLLHQNKILELLRRN